MIAVIIAGGSGTRLWPLSTPEYPKHLLKINNDELSLLQLTFQRAKELTSDIYVVSEASHIELVKAQLAELPENSFIVEPARRGTANCIIAALHYLSPRHDNDETIVIMPADHYIRNINGFKSSFLLADKVSSNEKNITLVGVEPNYPATGFGYIRKGASIDATKQVYNVESFKEKPDIRLAKEYLKSGEYLWNCGYFAGSINTFVNSMKQYAPSLFNNYKKLSKASPEEYSDAYLSFENESLDYGLIEKVKNLLVVQALFDWMDLGSFADLYQAVETDNSGNYISGGNVHLDKVENSFIINAEDKKVAVIGVDNIVVVNTADGILVVRKDLSQNVGDISKINKSKS